MFFRPLASGRIAKFSRLGFRQLALQPANSALLCQSPCYGTERPGEMMGVRCTTRHFWMIHVREVTSYTTARGMGVDGHGSGLGALCRHELLLGRAFLPVIHRVSQRSMPTSRLRCVHVKHISYDRDVAHVLSTHEQHQGQRSWRRMVSPSHDVLPRGRTRSGTYTEAEARLWSPTTGGHCLRECTSDGNSLPMSRLAQRPDWYLTVGPCAVLAVS